MEHTTPKPPVAETLPPPTPKAERPNFFERRRKKADAKKTPEAAQSAKPEAAAEKSKAQAFKENVFKVLFGEKPEPVPAAVQPEQSPVPATTAPETATPQLQERAKRTRRFARLVINTVLGAASAEQTHSKPLSTENLTSAASDLKDASDGLGEALKDSTTPTPAAPEASYDVGGDYNGATAESFMPPIAETVTLAAVAAERITRRLATLERVAEKNTAKTVVATGLGVLAVLFTGHEYLARKKVERKLTATQREVVAQQRTLEAQQAEFDNLTRRPDNLATMPREQRALYYDQLSEFTHQQAEITREVTREVRESHAPAGGGYAGELYIRHHDQPERPVRTTETRAHTRPEAAPAPEPLVRTERADTIEQGHQRRDTADSVRQGTAIGSGRTNDTRGALPPIPHAPLSPAAMRQLAAQKAKQARLKSNAWLYGVALAAAVTVIIVLLITLG